MKCKIKITLAIAGAVALIIALGTVGAIERGTIGIVTGAVRALVCMLMCGACVEIGEVL